MGLINNFIITLVSTIVFMTAIELISPNNSMKKYLKFVLGLILITTILNPIILFVNGGEKSITTTIEGYEKKIFEGDTSESTNTNEIEIRRKSFVNNFNKSCVELLKKEYKDMNFECKVDCSINFNEIDFNINKVTIDIINSKIKNIEKVSIGEDSKKKADDDTQLEIKEFISKEIGIPKDKIEVNYN